MKCSIGYIVSLYILMWSGSLHQILYIIGSRSPHTKRIGRNWTAPLSSYGFFLRAESRSCARHVSGRLLWKEHHYLVKSLWKKDLKKKKRKGNLFLLKGELPLYIQPTGSLVILNRVCPFLPKCILIHGKNWKNLCRKEV